MDAVRRRVGRRSVGIPQLLPSEVDVQLVDQRSMGRQRAVSVSEGRNVKAIVEAKLTQLLFEAIR